MRSSGPDEGFRIGFGLGHEAVDGELQVDDGLEDAALEMAGDSHDNACSHKESLQLLRPISGIVRMN